LNEIEVKILEINRKEIEKKLLSAGAKKISEKEVDTLFFDFKDFSIKKNKSLIRLRKEKETCTLTFKKLIESTKAKVANEYEVVVSDIDNARNILESIGLFVHAKMRKIRTSYKIDDTKFEFDKYLDEYDHIPEFLEIEAKNIEDIYKYAKLLGYGHDKCTAWSTLELINYYSNKKRNKQ
jgi:adenylate cyclase class 2